MLKILRPDSTIKSGAGILLTIKQNSVLTKSPNEVAVLYSLWSNTKKDNKEIIEDYTAKAVQSRLNLVDTYRSINNEEFIRKWRLGLGMDLDQINAAMDNLAQTPPVWRHILPIYQLIKTAKSYINRRSVTNNNRQQGNQYILKIIPSIIIMPPIKKSQLTYSNFKNQNCHQILIHLKFGINISKRPWDHSAS